MRICIDDVADGHDDDEDVFDAGFGTSRMASHFSPALFIPYSKRPHACATPRTTPSWAYRALRAVRAHCVRPNRRVQDARGWQLGNPLFMYLGRMGQMIDDWHKWRWQ